MPGFDAQLHDLFRGLGVLYLHERSFRMARGSLLADRSVFTVGRAELGPDAAARVQAVGERLGMPGALLAGLPRQVAEARAIHFGCEGGGRGELFKIYYEREAAVAEAAHAGRVLLAVAYKWDRARPGSCVTTRYDWLPRLPPEAVRAEMARIYGAQAVPAACAAEVLGLAAARAPAPALQYLEVHEEETGRRSFDLNVYAAGLSLAQAAAPLERLRRHFEVDEGAFPPLAAAAGGKRLGHVAGGVHRDGEAFATVYYGAEGYAPAGRRPQNPQ